MDKVIRRKDGAILFVCPGCNGIHSIKKGIWEFNDDLENPTIKPSILNKSTYNGKERVNYICHSFIADGKIKFLNDCTHKLAGKTVELMPVDSKHYNMDLVRNIRGED